jgi:aspartyl-tRNA synthetase
LARKFKRLFHEFFLKVTKVKIVNPAKLSLPLYIKPFNEASEAVRMKFRYLDLRHLWLQKNLKLRSSLVLKMRNFLAQEDFVDVETPTLFRRTPGGAREFIVPTRFENQYYSLVQSPQQFKQLLMVGGVSKYYQIAR